ncbi:MAG: DUF3791 domain-containing protein [Clostridium sp.]|nr:DUF3791 domain-containing protein [Clostridium sp.]
MTKLEQQPIHNEEELSFVIFCIENIAIKLGISADKVYHVLADESDILNGYIVPCFETLHSQSKEYIVEDIISCMRERGVKI